VAFWKTRIADCWDDDIRAPHHHHEQFASSWSSDRACVSRPACGADGSRLQPHRPSVVSANRFP
jgi:hypothetical protein